jgi:hypothetical protein
MRLQSTHAIIVTISIHAYLLKCRHFLNPGPIQCGVWVRNPPSVVSPHYWMDGRKSVAAGQSSHCSGSRPKQRQNAMDQHQELVAELRSLFGSQPITVLIHPIMIGVTGTIYKEFYDTMDLLGVSKAEAKRCAAVMHS